MELVTLFMEPAITLQNIFYGLVLGFVAWLVVLFVSFV